MTINWLDNVFVKCLTNQFDTISTHSIFLYRVYTEELPADAGIMLFIKDLNQADSGKYVCRGTYANNEEMQTQVVISTFSKYPLHVAQSYIYIYYTKNHSLILASISFYLIFKSA